MGFYKKLQHKYIWKRLFLERLAEPLHLNLIAIFVWLFGSYRSKIAFDLIVRQQHAYCLLKAADRALKLGYKSVSVIEFGVASGAGILNIQKIASRIQKITGVKFDIYGFDNIVGMPTHLDYRDHPDLYKEGDYKMNYELLKKQLNQNVKITNGNIKNNVREFIKNLSPQSPIGFVAIDVDYYSSTVDALTVFDDDDASKYLDIVYLYVDDIGNELHNSLCGELLAIREFNDRHNKMVIEKHSFLENTRVFRRANWLKHIYFLHNLAHKRRNEIYSGDNRSLNNYYLRD